MYFLGHLTLLSAALAAPLLSIEQDGTVVPGHYIVKFKHDETAVSTSALKALKKSLSIPPEFEYSIPGFHGFAGILSEIDLADLQASDDVSSSGCYL